MKESIVLQDHDVWIEDGLIRKVGINLQVDPKAVEIDGSGKYLLPGLIDMHGHLLPGHPMIDTWKIHFLLSGVTSIRDMNGMMGTEKLKLRDAINQNKVFAPTIYQASQLIDSRKGQFFQQAATPADGRRLVVEVKKAGFDFIKVYDGLTKDVYHAIIDEAARRQIPVVGHVPSAILLADALAAKQNSIEHLMGFFEWKGSAVQSSAPNDYALKAARSETWICPTLYNHHLNLSRGTAQSVLKDSASGLIPKGLYDTWEKITKNQSREVVEMVDKNGEASFDVLKNIVLSLDRVDAKLIAGTDAGNLPFLIPGSSLIEELKLLSKIGISNYKVLGMATSNAAVAMNKQSFIGTVEEGKRADLILLQHNPIENLHNLYSNKGIMVRGIWISDAERNRISKAVEDIFGRD
jgi:imidazolonepropionase-like amidohydrolase